MKDFKSNYSSNKLAGKFLIASPYSSMSDVFNKSLIYVASHSDSGAVGMVVNHLVHSESQLQNILKAIKDNKKVQEMKLPVFLGGPVETERGFVLHTAEYNQNLLLKFPDDLAVSSNVSILEDIESGNGPKNSLFFLGYTGWSAGQLEEEINNNLWLVSECDKELIFSEDNEHKWDLALSKIGVSQSMFSASSGMC